MSALRIVSARREHHSDVARLFPELGVDDPVPEAARWWNEMAPDTLFIEDVGRVVAYGYAQAPSTLGYVRHVIVDPARRGEGLGRRLMHALAQHLRESGCERWQLNVLVDNATALALYRSLGLAIDFHTWVVRLPPEKITALPRANAIDVVATLEADDAALEREFEIAPGLLTMFRGKPEHVLVTAVERASGTRVGFAHFDPLFPGCWPIRARRAEHARALLEALMPHFPAGKPCFQLVIERDEALATAMLAAGGMLRHSIAHMEGPLPTRRA